MPDAFSRIQKKKEGKKLWRSESGTKESIPIWYDRHEGGWANRFEGLRRKMEWVHEKDQNQKKSALKRNKHNQKRWYHVSTGKSRGGGSRLEILYSKKQCFKKNGRVAAPKGSEEGVGELQPNPNREKAVHRRVELGKEQILGGFQVLLGRAPKPTTEEEGKEISRKGEQVEKMEETRSENRNKPQNTLRIKRVGF